MPAIKHIFLVLCTIFAACSSTKGAQGDYEFQEDEEGTEQVDQVGFSAPGRGESVPSVAYGKTADLNWQRGEEAFADEEYLAAQRYFSFIRSKFPYSRYAALSDVRIADCQFERGRYIEAIDTYQNYVRMHPTHPKVPYALYRVGMCYYEQIPGDWFLLPPSEERDQAAVRDAERALRNYLERFPKDENLEAAKKVYTEVRKRLMAHERYVADFYCNLGRDRACVGRLEVIRASFSDVGLDDGLLFEIVEIYARLGEVDKAKSVLSEMEKKFPSSPNVGRARSLVGGT